MEDLKKDYNKQNKQVVGCNIWKQFVHSSKTFYSCFNKYFLLLQMCVLFYTDHPHLFPKAGVHTQWSHRHYITALSTSHKEQTESVCLI